MARARSLSEFQTSFADWTSRRGTTSWPIPPASGKTPSRTAMNGGQPMASANGMTTSKLARTPTTPCVRASAWYVAESGRGETTPIVDGGNGQQGPRSASYRSAESADSARPGRRALFSPARLPAKVPPGTRVDDRARETPGDADKYTETDSATWPPEGTGAISPR